MSGRQGRAMATTAARFMLRINDQLYHGVPLVL